MNDYLIAAIGRAFLFIAACVIVVALAIALAAFIVGRLTA